MMAVYLLEQISGVDKLTPDTAVKYDLFANCL